MKENKIICAVSRDPMTVLLFGAFPALAASCSAKGALAMGITVILVMIVSAALVSLLKNSISECLFLPVNAALSCFLMVAAGMLLNAWFPGAFEQLGIYVSLAAVSLLLYGINAFAFEKKVSVAVKNGLFTGLFYAAVLLVVAIIRELFGSGSVFGAELGFMKSFTDSVLVQPAGGFLIFAFAAATVKMICAKEKKESKETEE